MKRMNQQDEKVSSMARMAKVIRAVLQTQGEWFTHSSMVRKLGLFPSAVHRYLQALVEEDWLEQEQETNRYRLTRDIKNLLVIQGLRLIKPYEQEDV